MTKRSPRETNPYLRDWEKARKMLIWSVATSTAIETGEKAETIARRLMQGERRERARKRRTPVR